MAITSTGAKADAILLALGNDFQAAIGIADGLDADPVSASQPGTIAALERVQNSISAIMRRGAVTAESVAVKARVAEWLGDT